MNTNVCGVNCSIRNLKNFNGHQIHVEVVDLLLDVSQFAKNHKKVNFRKIPAKIYVFRIFVVKMLNLNSRLNFCFE